MNQNSETMSDFSQADHIYLGQYLTGTFLSLACGTCCFAFCIQYLMRSNERGVYKWTTCSMALLTIFHMALVWSDALMAFDLHFGDIEWANGISIPYAMMEGLNAVMAGVVLVFYSWRVFAMYQRRLWMALVLGVFVAFTVVSGIYTATMLGLSNSGEYSEDFGRVQILSYVSAAVNDFIIAVAMLRHFVKVRRKGIAENSGKILVRLAILTISTNTFTTGVTLASMISYITESGGDAVLDPLLGHCYTITLLTWLASRTPETGATTRCPSKAHHSVNPQTLRRPSVALHATSSSPMHNVIVATNVQRIVSDADGGETIVDLDRVDFSQSEGEKRHRPFESYDDDQLGVQ